MTETFDVAVLGGGNAGLCAALSARERGASVIVVEGAPRAFRGGNSRHTRNLRSMHDAPTALLTDAYTEDEYVADLRARDRRAAPNEALARLVVRGSAGVSRLDAAVRHQAAAAAAGHAASRSHERAFSRRRQGADEQLLRGGRAPGHPGASTTRRSSASISRTAGFDRRRCRSTASVETIAAKTVVLAAGGFESNLDWLREIWGEAADNFIIRGTPYNTGTVLKLMLDAGAQPVGDPTQFHCVAVDARAPKFDGGIVTRLDSVSLGIVVNAHGERFYDEGEDFWPKRYAIWGRLVAQQPGADRLFDRRCQGDRPLHAVDVSAEGRAVDSRARAHARSRAGRARPHGRSTFNRAVRRRDVRSRGRSTTAGRKA